MNSNEISEFENLQAQLQSLYIEIGTLSKKKPDDAVNEFKLMFINQVLEKSNSFLGEKNRPFENFHHFEVDNIPSNSDVVLILSQYLNCLEKLRADNIGKTFQGWFWMINGKISEIHTGPPKKLKY